MAFGSCRMWCVFGALLLICVLDLPRLCTAEIKHTSIMSDTRSLILFDQFGFEIGGMVELKVSGVLVQATQDGVQPNLSLMGFFISTDEVLLKILTDLEQDPTQCILQNPSLKVLALLRQILEAGTYNNTFSVPDTNEYTLYFLNCQSNTQVSMNVRTAMYNVEGKNKARDYLPAGQTQLPKLYFTFFLAYIVLGGTWIYVCVKRKEIFHRIHVLMGILVFLKALNILAEAEDKFYIKRTGTAHGWDIVFYIFGFFRGIMLFTVIVLIGTGWSFLKPFLQDKEKRILMIVIPLQVLANIASVVIDETGPSTKNFFTWQQLFLLVDIICCCAVLFPIVWSIKHLREASHTDGKAARNLVKLTLFRQYYIVVVCYIYFTRIIVFALTTVTAYRYKWVTQFCAELATISFYVFTGYKFRPVVHNPYFILEEQMDEEKSGWAQEKHIQKLNEKDRQSNHQDQLDTLIKILDKENEDNSENASAKDDKFEVDDEKIETEIKDDKEPGDREVDDMKGEEGIEEVTLKTFPVCDERYTEVIPCLDRQLLYDLKIKLNLTLMEHYERHCPPQERCLNCLIPPPPHYKVPVRWPMSRDQVWRANVPHTFLAVKKSDQHWMIIKGERVFFPGGGTHFHDGADKYIAALGKMLKNPNGDLSGKGKIRTVLDVGCGVASFGAYLLPLNILAMSIAPNDVHENQIQFALERGIPSTLGVLGTKRLPYPSKSFELAHCSRCRIDWAQRNGILLLELDRLLRPGGYFAWSSPPAYKDDDEDRQIWSDMDSLARSMCWSIAAKEGQTVIWMKPLTNECYNQRPAGASPSLCDTGDDPDAVWQAPMKACITPLPEYNNFGKGRGLMPWPKRLNSPPPRLQELHISAKVFQKDTIVWQHRVETYWKHLELLVEDDSLRNVMDMNAHFGGFAAALNKKPVWVMNVVPSTIVNSLKIIFDRGLIGTSHDWCEAFSTYPRTYDLIHAWTIFSDIEARGCSVEDLLLEIDRILRPMGIVIIRDKPFVINQIRRYLPALRWDKWSREVAADLDEVTHNEEKILLARKQLWHPEESL